MEKHEFYKKLLRKLKMIEKGEMTLTDYISEVEEKIKVSHHESIQQGADSGQLQQHLVMQAEGSDGAEVAAVGNGAAGQSVSVGIMKWCDSCGKVTKWIDGECEVWIAKRGGSAKGALPR